MHVELVADHLNPGVETAVVLTATLLLRMAEFAPTIHLIVPKDRTAELPLLPDTPLPEALAAAHVGFNSVDRFITTTADQCDLRLIYSGSRSGVSVSAAGWAFALGERLDGEGNALAAGYVGALAAAEALKILLGSLGATSTRTRPWRGAANLWDYGLSAYRGPAVNSVEIGPHAWIGAGGVASAAAWVLSALPTTGTRLTGTGVVFDNDVIDEDGTNLNRHLTALMEHRGMPKAVLLADLLAQAGLRLEPREALWNQLPHADRHPRVAVVSVDDDEVRRSIQYDMPALIINAGTGDTGEYQATRHDFLNHACLACISHADQTAAGPEHSLARRLGLPVEDLLPHLHSRQPLPGHLLDRAALTAEMRREAASVPARNLIEHFCGALHTQEGPALSIPMLSTAAGILMATELLKSSIGHSGASGQILRTNILTGPHRRWRSIRAKSAGCLCHDDLYRDHYRQRWER